MRTSANERHQTRVIADWPKRWTWRNLFIATTIQERLRRRFTPAGQAVLAATASAGLFGVDTRMTAAHQAFALGVGLLLLAWLASLGAPRGLRAERRMPRYATSGERCEYRVDLLNTGSSALTGVALTERLPDPRPDRAAFLATRTPFEARLNPLERLFGYPRWEWLVQRGRAAAPEPPVQVSALGPGERSTARLSLTPARRGWLYLDALTASKTDPLGLMRKEAPIAGSARLLVLPRRYPVRPLPRVGSRKLQPGGVSLTSSVGDSREFIGLRDYVPGDSPRHIHWAAWARCGEPVVKEYQDEYFSRQALVLDSFVGSSGSREDAFECAVSVAASLVGPLTSAGAVDSLLDLIFVADRAHVITGGRGLMGAEGMLELLACLEPSRSDDFDVLSGSVSAHAPRIGGCICVLLGWDKARQAFVDSLLGSGLAVTALIIGAPDAPSIHPTHEHRAAQLIRIDPARPEAALAML